MKRTAFVIKLRPGMMAEYKRRHDAIWPELSELITRRGMRNYSIWYYKDLLFAYYEADDEGIQPLATDADQLLSMRWEEYMSDIIEMVTDKETGEALSLECMFIHD